MKPTAVNALVDACEFWWNEKKNIAHVAFHDSIPGYVICVMCSRGILDKIRHTSKTRTAILGHQMKIFNTITAQRLRNWIDAKLLQSLPLAIGDTPPVMREFVDEAMALLDSAEWEADAMHAAPNGTIIEALSTIPSLVVIRKFLLMTTAMTPPGRSVLRYMRGVALQDWESSLLRLKVTQKFAETVGSFLPYFPVQLAYSSSPAFISLMRDHGILPIVEQRNVLIRRLFRMNRLVSIDGRMLATAFLFCETALADAMNLACVSVVQMWRDLFDGIVPVTMLDHHPKGSLISPFNASDGVLSGSSALDTCFQKYRTVAPVEVEPFRCCHRTIIPHTNSAVWLRALNRCLAKREPGQSRLRIMSDQHDAPLGIHRVQIKKSGEWQDTWVEIHTTALRSTTYHLSLHTVSHTMQPRKTGISICVCEEAACQEFVHAMQTKFSLPADVIVITSIQGLPGILTTLNGASIEKELGVDVDDMQRATFLRVYMESCVRHVHHVIDGMKSKWDSL